MNPFPGKLYNKPVDDESEAVDVYDGCMKDYTGADVTPDNFISIITGDEDAMSGVGSGKVLKSTSKDHVFINFVDHGGVGLIGFPTDFLYANDLNDALQTMYDNNTYDEL